jgi:hypothetical protein
MQATVSATGDDGQGVWLSPREAQAALGIGERTLFRRIQRGHLQRHQRADGRVEVWVPSARPSPTVPETDTDGQTPTDQAARALAVVDRLNAAVAQQVTPLLAELATARQELVQLARENGQLQERVTALEARLTPTVPETVSDGPWWARWLAWWRR